MHLVALRSWITGCIAPLSVVALLGAGAAAFLASRLNDPAPQQAGVPLHVDASLTDGGARVVTEAWPIVRYVEAGDGTMILDVYDSAGEEKCQHVQFTLQLGGGASFVPTLLRWYDPRGTIFFNDQEWGESIEGTVTIDADRSPAQGDERIVAYELRAMRDDQPVELRGKVRIPYAGGPR